MTSKNAGEYAYLLGLVVAVVAGIALTVGALTGSTSAWIALLLVVIGIVVGLMNVSEKESMTFLIAAIALVLTGSAGVFSVLNTVISPLGTLLDSIVSNFALLAAPAAIITAVKLVHGMAKGK